MQHGTQPQLVHESVYNEADVTCPQVHQKMNWFFSGFSFFEGGVLHVDASHDYFSISGFCYYPSKAPSAKKWYYSRQ